PMVTDNKMTKMCSITAAASSSPMLLPIRTASALASSLASLSSSRTNRDSVSVASETSSPTECSVLLVAPGTSAPGLSTIVGVPFSRSEHANDPPHPRTSPHVHVSHGTQNIILLSTHSGEWARRPVPERGTGRRFCSSTQSVALAYRSAALLWQLFGDHVHDRGVGEGRGVPHVPVLGDVPQQASHDLAGAGLGQLGHSQQAGGFGDRAEGATEVVTQLLEEFVGNTLLAPTEDDEADDRLACDLVGGTDHRGLGDSGMGHQGGLHFGGGDVVARDEHDVVHATEQPKVAVLVLLGTVTGEVEAGELGPVGLLVALLIAPDAAKHGGPGFTDDQDPAALAGRDALALIVDDVGDDTGNTAHRRAGLTRGHAWEGTDHDGPGLGLPPGVHHWCVSTTDVLPVPDVGLGVDRFTDGSDDAQAGQVELGGDLLAPPHEGTDRRGCHVGDGDLVLFDDLPEASLVWGVRGALVHDDGGGVGERAVDDVGVARHPTDVCGAPVDVLLRLDVENRRVRVVDLGEVTTGGVQDALGLGRGTAGVHDVQRVLGVVGLGRVLG